MIRDQQEGRRPINRPEWIGKRRRRLQKLVGKSTWFRKQKKKTKPGEGGGGKKKERNKEKDEVMDREEEVTGDRQ